MKKIRFIKSHINFSDKRGSIKGIFNNFKVEESNFIMSVKNSRRGGHYHKKLTEIIYVIDGIIDFYIRDIRKRNSKELIFRANSGQAIIIYPYELHSSTCLKKSRCINYLSKKINFNSLDMYKK